MYSTKRPHKFFYLLTVVVFLTQLVLPTAARAQGEVPPADPAATSVPASTDAAPTDAAPTDAPTDAVTPAPTDTAPAEPAVDVTEVPAGTDVVVLDESGNPLPLATQAASDALVVGDPMWCPEGITPGEAGCTESYSTLTDLLTNSLVGSENGVIWIQNGVRSEGEATQVVISQPSNTNRLTLMGGWDGSIGSTATNTAAPSIYSVPIAIFWGGNLNIYNLTLDSTNTYGGYSLTAETGGSLDADNISVIDSNGSGALFQAVDGITVDDSTFDDNNGNGLVVNQTGAGSQHHNTVRLNDVNASYNNGNGVQVDTVSGSVTVKGSAAQYSVLSENKNDGLNIDTEGGTFIQYVSSTGNYADGADIFTQTGDITIKNSAFDNNDGDGLNARTDGGNITLDTVSADSNGYEYYNLYGNYNYWEGDGANLEAWNAESADTGNVSITNSSFDENGVDGLNAGAEYNISLSGVSADYNGFGYSQWWDGEYFYDYSGTGADLRSFHGSISVADGSFDDNSDGGLYAETGFKGGCDLLNGCSITLSDITAYDNWNYGAELDATDASVSVSGSEFDYTNEIVYDYWSGDYWYTGWYGGTGLDISSDYAITLNDVSADSNDNYGADMWADNGDISVTNNSSFDYNGNDGLYAGTYYGNISLDDVSAYDNSDDGAYLETYYAGDVTVTNSDFNYNGDSGLVVYAGDDGCDWESDLTCNITLNNVEAGWYDWETDDYYGNDNYGAYLWSDYGTISVTDSNFSDNGDTGLYAWTDEGDVKVDNSSADYNDYSGADLGNDYGGKVTVTDSSFYDNSDYGLEVNAGDEYCDWSTCDISLDSVYASDNGYSGADVWTDWGTISILNSSFYSNSDSGLLAFTDYGNISLVNVNADNNDEFGAKLGTDSGGDISVTGDASLTDIKGFGFSSSYSSFDNNGQVGLAAGAGYDTCDWESDFTCNISVDGITANDNNIYGAWLWAPDGNVTVKNSEFSYTGYGESYLLDDEWSYDGTGLSARAEYDINLENVNTHDNGIGTANDAEGDGADLYSNDGDITITDSTFNYNDFAGVYAYADWGNISLTGVDAFYNGAQGADLETYDGGSVFVTDSNFNNNTQRFESSYAGLEVNAGDNGCEWFGGCNITLTGVEASSNWGEDGDIWWGGYGADLWSDWGTVSVAKSIFSDNGDDGLSASTDYGNLFIDHVTAYGNDGDGVELWSNYGGDVTITNTKSYDNNYGFDIATADDANQCEGDYTCNVFMSGVVADGNDYAGADVYAYSGSIFVSNSSFTGTYDGDGFYGEAGWSDWNDGLQMYESYCFPGPCDITFDDVNASGNYSDGANLWSYGGNVSVSDSTFNGNGNDGLSIGVAGHQQYNFRNISAPTLPTISLDNVDASGNGDEGFVFYGYPGGFADDEYSDPANITIVCSTFNDNASYGLDINNEGGTVTMGDVTALGNNLGGIQTSIFPSPIAGGNCYVVDHRKSFEYYQDAQTGEGATVPFACDQFYGLHLWLVSGDFVEIPCSSRGTGTHAIAYTVPGANLPAQPNGTFMSALHFTVLNAHNIGQVLVSFKLAAGETAAGYSIVHWNGTAWETVSNTSLMDGFFQAWVNQTGFYALVKN